MTRITVSSLAIAFLLATACGNEPSADGEQDAGNLDDPPSEDAQPSWNVVIEDLDGAILGFWGPSLDSLFAVGGRLARDGGEAIILHHDGEQWFEMEVDAPALWWVHGFGRDDVWAVGDRGVILHFDGTEWTRVRGGDEPYTLWGVWGASNAEMWAVGGSIERGATSVILHYDGSTWEPVADVGRPDELLFKVWGSAADHAFAVGSAGALLRWDGMTWNRTDVPADWRLVTVHGRSANDIYAVGGLGRSLLVHFDGTEWTPLEAEPTNGLMGVWADPAGPLLITGFRGVVLLEEDGGWLEQDPGTQEDLHAAWGDGAGNYLVGGGNLLSSRAGRGVISGRGDVAGGGLQPW